VAWLGCRGPRRTPGGGACRPACRTDRAVELPRRRPRVGEPALSKGIEARPGAAHRQRGGRGVKRRARRRRGGARVPISLAVTSQTIDLRRTPICSPCPCSRTEFSVRGANVVDRALGGRLAGFMEDVGFAGKRMRRSPCRPSARRGARGGARRPRRTAALTPDVLRRGCGQRRPPSEPRPVVVTSCWPGRFGARRAAQALAEGSCSAHRLRRVQVGPRRVEARPRPRGGGRGAETRAAWTGGRSWPAPSAGSRLVN